MFFFKFHSYIFTFVFAVLNIEFFCLPKLGIFGSDGTIVIQVGGAGAVVGICFAVEVVFCFWFLFGRIRLPAWDLVLQDGMNQFFLENGSSPDLEMVFVH